MDIVGRLQGLRSIPPRIRARRLGAVPILLALVVVSGCVGGAADPPTNVTDKAATLQAHGTAGGKQASWWFEYGTSTNYGTSTPHRDGGSGTDTKNVSERVTGPTTVDSWKPGSSPAEPVRKLTSLLQPEPSALLAQAR